MKNIKKLISLMLITTLTMSLGGCSNSKEKNKEMGRYVEKKIELPDNIVFHDMTKLDDGSIKILGYDENGQSVVYTSNKENSEWKKTEINNIEVDDKYVYQGQSSMLKDGRIIVGYYINEVNTEDNNKLGDTQVFNENNVPEIKHFFVDENNKKEELTIPLPQNIESGENSYYGESSNFILGDNGDIFLKSAVGNEVIQLDGANLNEKFRYSTPEWVEGYSLVGNSIIIQDFENVSKYDIITGEKIGNIEDLQKKIEVLSDKYRPIILTTTSKDKIYFYNPTGLYQYDINNNKSELIIDGALSRFGNNDISVNSFMEFNNGEFLTLFSDSKDGVSHLVNYVYDPNIPKYPENSLKVYSLVQNETLRQAISDFSKNNPEIYVKYEIGLDSETAMTETDAIKKLNTEIMSGDGPDVILLDELDYESFGKKGLLEDISSIVNETEGLFKNIVNSFTIDNKIYEFPTAFTMPMITGDKQLINKIDDLKSLNLEVKNLSDKSEIRIFNESTSPKILLYSLYSLYDKNLLNDDNTINKENLKEILTLTKEIYDINKDKNDKFIENYYKENDITINEEFDNTSEENDNTNVEESTGNDDIYEIYNVRDNLSPYPFFENFIYEKEPAHFVLGGLRDINSFGSLVTVSNSKKNIDYKMIKNNDKNIFIPMDLIGISSKAKNKENAKKFIKYMLSEEGQNSGWKQGLLINKNAFLNQFNELMNNNKDLKFDKESNHHIFGVMSIDDGNGGTKEFKQLIPNEDDINKLVENIEKLEISPVINKKLLNEIGREFEKSINENKSIDETINNIVNELDLYLSE